MSEDGFLILRTLHVGLVRIISMESGSNTHNNKSSYPMLLLYTG